MRERRKEREKEKEREIETYCVMLCFLGILTSRKSFSEARTMRFTQNHDSLEPK